MPEHDEESTAAARATPQRLTPGGWRMAATVAALAILLSFTAGAADAETRPSGLTPDERQFLKDTARHLCDPRGATRVRVRMSLRTVWAKTVDIVRDGWLVAGQNGAADKILFTDGESIPATTATEIVPFDFVRFCEHPEDPQGKALPSLGRDDFMQKSRLGQVRDPEFVLAAWLVVLGHDELAAQLLRRSVGATKLAVDEATQLWTELAWSAYARMVFAYMVRADDEARLHGERLTRLLPDVFAPGGTKDAWQSRALLAELQRRKDRAADGKPRSHRQSPPDYAEWDIAKRIAFHIDQLDEVDVRQTGQPGGVNLANDPNVMALIEIGDPAVPALLEVLGSDTRLTRSVHVWRDFRRAWTVLSVREAALAALMSILHTKFFIASATGDNVTSQGPAQVAALTAEIRAYWERFGKMPYPARMMATLADATVSSERRGEAAHNLACFGEKRTLGTTVWVETVVAPPVKPNPVIDMFTGPTAAEAIVAAMDSEIAACLKTAAAPHDEGNTWSVDSDPSTRAAWLTRWYIEPLAELGDRRIAPEIRRRWGNAAAVPSLSRALALACHRLGDSGPIDALAAQVRTGALAYFPKPTAVSNTPEAQPKDGLDRVDAAIKAARGLTENEWHLKHEAEAALTALVDAASPACEAALGSLARPEHSYYHQVAAWILTNDEGFWRGDNHWSRHPFTIAIRRRALDNTNPTGRTFRLDTRDRSGELLISGDELGVSWVSATGWLADPGCRRDEAAERVCDRVAADLQQFIWGLPWSHPLHRDVDQQLAAQKAFLDRWRDRLRPLASAEAKALRWSSRDALVADIRPLGRPATAADVDAGKAVFHLEGKGRQAQLSLPAVGVLARDAGKEGAARMLIVQAEFDPAGNLFYGVIGYVGICRLPASDLTTVAPVAESDRN